MAWPFLFALPPSFATSLTLCVLTEFSGVSSFISLDVMTPTRCTNPEGHWPQTLTWPLLLLLSWTTDLMIPGHGVWLEIVKGTYPIVTSFQYLHGMREPGVDSRITEDTRRIACQVRHSQRRYMIRSASSHTATSVYTLHARESSAHGPAPSAKSPA